MTLENINWFDISVIGIVLGFAVFGFVSGFTDKFFSMLSWTAAAILTLHIYPYLRPWVSTFITQDIPAMLVTGAAVFIVLLITFKLGTASLSKSVKGSPLGSLDRGLGIILGAFTGFLALVSIHLGIRYFAPHATYPHWITHAKTWSFITLGGEYVEKIIPLELPKISSLPPLPKERIIAKLSHTSSTRSEEKRVGYKKKDREALTRILARHEKI